MVITPGRVVSRSQGPEVLRDFNVEEGRVDSEWGWGLGY